MSVLLELKSCRQCPNCKIERDYTSDSFEFCERLDCQKMDKNIVRYKDWNEKDPTIPDWCPLPKAK